MLQFTAINANVEVNGQTVLSIANGLGEMKNLGLSILSGNGIKNPKPDGWYKQQDWLNAFKQIATAIGPNTLFSIGKSIPENAKFPPEINDIHKALASIDVAYHMNHRLHDKVMFDPATGEMLEGIGHYSYKKVGDNVVEIMCDNPYPCDFDRGIIEAMARKFKPIHAIASTELAETNGCRKKCDSSCLYRISWKF
jgi:hypothetical protein